MIRLDQIDHVALAVADLQRSIAWYQSVLGLERRHLEVWGDFPVFLCAGDTCLALFPAAAPQLALPPVKPSVGMRHLAFRTGRKSFLEAQQFLGEKKIDFEFQDHQISHSIYFHDPDGHEIEITTYELS